MTDKRGERHRYGQHYTPVEVARLLGAFAVRSSRDLIFDPACGDGRLLAEALRLKIGFADTAEKKRGQRKDARRSREVFGVDLSAPAIERAARTGAQVARADFFEIEPGMSGLVSHALPLQFDAIIGNPPYIRQEVMGSGDKARLASQMARDRERMPDVFWPRWSGRSDIYVYFFAHSIRFLSQGGRVVFLTASSWLDVAYGLALRRFLTCNFRVLAVIESAVESFFDDASINTSITVLERETDERARCVNPVRFVQLTRPLAEIFGNFDSSGCRTEEAIEFARAIEETRSPIVNKTHRIRIVSQAELPGAEILREGDLSKTETRANPSAGWGKYMHAKDVFFQVLDRGGLRLKPLADLARVRFGVKTGANEFFYVVGRKDARMMHLGDVASVRRGLTTGANEFFYLKAVDDRNPSGGKQTRRQKTSQKTHSATVVEDGRGARHKIESRFLSPVIFSLKEISGIEIEPGDGGKLFFNCQAPPDELAGTEALKYIRSGEQAGYHLRPTCKGREPWYGVTRGMKPAPLIFPAKVGERWLVALNRAGVYEDKKLYGVFPRDTATGKLLAALLNSTWARYFAEITCRQMTGAQAIADIDVAVAEQILIPDPRQLSRALRKRLEAALDALTGRRVVSVFEEVKRADRRNLDEAVLAAIGFTNRAERRKILEQLYEAVLEFVSARLAKAQK